MLQELVLANCHIFTVFQDSEDSPRWAFFIDAAVMLALQHLGMTTYIYVHIYMYIYIIESRLSPGNEVSFGRSFAKVGRLGAENNCYLTHYHIVSYYYITYHITSRSSCCKVKAPSV